MTQMGNSPAKNFTSRQKMGKFLNKLPNWLFEPTPRIIINEAVLRIKDEVDDLEDDEYWDSSLEDSANSEIQESIRFKTNNRRISERRQSVKVGHSHLIKNCCHNALDNEKIEALQTELRLLREQISQLTHPKIVEIPRPISQEVSSTVKTPLKSNDIPLPPPFPPTLISTDVNIDDTPISKNNVLKDISNVKLRPITSTPIRIKSIQKPPDIRNELYDILKRRYAAMHSPAPSRIHDESDDENNFFENKLEMHSHVLVC